MKLIIPRYSVVFAASFAVLTWAGAAYSQSIKIVKSAQLGPITAQKRQPRQAPRALTAVEKVRGARQISGATGGPGLSVGASTRLSAKTPFISGKGYLFLSAPKEVNPFEDGGMINFGPGSGTSVFETSGIVISYSGLAPGKHFIDIAVQGSAGTQFTIGQDANLIMLGSSQFTDHLMVVVDIHPNNPYVCLTIMANQPWTFFSAEISPIK